MRTRMLSLALATWIGAAAASAGLQAPASPQNLTGEWMMTIVIFGNERSERLYFKTEKGKVSGSVRRRGKEIAFPVKAEGDTVEFVIPASDGSKQTFTGKMA